MFTDVLTSRPKYKDSAQEEVVAYLGAEAYGTFAVVVVASDILHRTAMAVAGDDIARAYRQHRSRHHQPLAETMAEPT